MTCLRLLSRAAWNDLRRPAKSLTAQTKAQQGGTVTGITAHSFSGTALPSASPISLGMPSSLSTQQLPLSQLSNVPGRRHGRQSRINQHPKRRFQLFSTRANLIEPSIQSDLTQALSSSAVVGSRYFCNRHLQTARFYSQQNSHGLFTTNSNPPVSGWRKPIVSSSPSPATLSSLVVSSPLAGSTKSISITNTRPSALHVSFSSAEPDPPASLEGTVGVDMEELLELASKKTTPLSLKDMYKYAIVDAANMEQRIRNAQFLHAELPVRIAQRAVDLLTLPHGLNEIPAVLQVAHVYLLYLEKFQECPLPMDVESEDSFTDMLQSMVLERSSIPNAIARGVDSWIQNEKAIGEEAAEDGDENIDETSFTMKRARSLKEMEDALYRFFTARVGLRFLTEHHILSSPARAAYQLNDNSIDVDSKNSFLGCIQPNCCPTQEVRKVVEAVRRKTMDYYGDGVCPEIQIVDGDIAAQQQPQHKKRHTTNNFTYVPSHLHYMVGELLKNACRATVKRYRENGSKGKIPPIKIVIVKGAEDVTIKIADRGGGIPRSQMAEIWKFAHSTSAKDEVESETDFGVNEITGAAIRGFGLPLARIYARYLGGELTLKSLEGYGLDAYLHLPRLGDQCENLPLPVRFSPSNLTSNPLRRPEIIE